MRRLGAELALFLAPGDLVALRGDLGTGKTVLARAILHALAPGRGDFEVPSPTFTLVQPYDFTRVPVHHVDLYRLERGDDVLELGLDEALETGAVLMEWPQRLGDLLPADRLEVAIEHAGAPQARRVALRGHGTWRARLERIRAASAFVAGSAFADCRRAFLQGDASRRRYERLTCGDGRRAVLMDMPARPDGEPAGGGLAYSALVHLAEDVRPFVAVGAALRARGIDAPELYAHDMAKGFVLIEDFGDRVLDHLAREGADTEPVYEVACDILVHLARHECDPLLPLPDGTTYTVPAFDRRALRVEAELVNEWFWLLLGRTPPPQQTRADFTARLEACFDRLAPGPRVLVLRDFHSPNLIWLPERQGLHRLGVIDHQDAVIGSPAYDLVSLLQDARIDVDRQREQRVLARYVAQRAGDAGFDEAALRSDYAVLGAQRASKILGIFARLKMRDGKPGYLRHLPRVSDYLERNLAHPALRDLKAWYDAHLPHDMRAAAGAAAA